MVCSYEEIIGPSCLPRRGKSNISTTQRYIAVNDDVKRRAVELVGG